jgi:hypothetical protein
MSPATLLSASLHLVSIARKIFGRFTLLAQNLVALLPLVPVSVALAAFIVFALIPRRTIYLLLVILSLTAAIYLINPMISIYSNHGMAHLGFVYAAKRFNWPPEDPYFAGTPLRYPWGYDAMVAVISSLLDVSPGWVYAGSNLAALAVTILAVAGIARLLEGDAPTANCAVVLAVLAPTFLGAGAGGVFWPVSPVTDPALWGPEALPPADKFSSINGMPVGMALGVVFLYKICSIMKSTQYNIMDRLTLFALVMITGYLYPHIWLTLSVMAVACTAVAFRAGERRKAIALLAALLLGNRAVVPYLHALTGGRPRGQKSLLFDDPRVYVYHLLHVSLILLPLWLLIALARKNLEEQLRRSVVHRAVLGSGLALLATFIVLNVPGGGYKFRAMAVFCLAPLAAPGLKRIYDWNKTALVLILALQLLPFVHHWYSKSPWGWGRPVEPCYWQGPLLRHGLPEEDDLYRWLREHTPVTAILIDNKPYAPVYAQRSLLVARNPQVKLEDWWTKRDGWLFTTNQWLEEMNGHSADEIRRRNELVEALYRKADSPSAEDLVRQLDEVAALRPVFVIARNDLEKAALESRPFLERVAGAGDWAIYALARSKASAVRKAASRGTSGRSFAAMSRTPITEFLQFIQWESACPLFSTSVRADGE